MADELSTYKDKAGHAAGHMVGKEGAVITASATANSIFSLPVVGFVSAIGVILNQRSYDKRLKNLREMYKYEVGAKLGKIPDDVTNKDLQAVAKGDPEHGIAGNKTFSNFLKKLKVSKTVGTIVSIASILTTVAIVGSVFSTGGLAIPGVGTGVTEALSAVIEQGTIGYYAAKAAIGVAVHQTIEKPMNWLGKKIFDIEKVTTQERIAELDGLHKKGRAISRERVMGVFVSANKEISDFINEAYGKEYDKLAIHEKQEIVNSFGKHIPLKEIVDNLNSGKVRVSELAFSVEGQRSGIKMGSVPTNRNVIGKTRGVIKTMSDKFNGISDKQATYPQAIPASSSYNKEGIAPKRTAVEYNNPIPTRSFVERYEAEKRVPLQESRTIH
ncbi:MAG: hypothetical protein R3D71_06690 [Rickettsiales bacterium]